MGTHLFPLPNSTIASSLPPTNPNNPLPRNPRFSNNSRCCSTRYRPSGSGGPHWDSNAETIRTERFKFNLEDEFVTDDEEDDDDEFGFGSRAQRIWWSDDEDFGVWEESVGTGWIFKAFRAFGWMLPAVAISMLLGTGPDAFFMALALPLAQSVLSLAIDKLWGRTSHRPKPRPRTKKKPFARAADNIRTSEEKQEENIGTGKGKGSHQSWAATNNGSVEKGDKSMPSFGGWDELDKGGRTDKVPKRAPTQKADRPPKQQKKGKLSRRGRNRDTPMLLRLLIAVFPFLGSWTKFLL